MFKRLRETVYGTCEVFWCQKKFKKIVPWQIGCKAEHTREARILREANGILKKAGRLK